MGPSFLACPQYRFKCTSHELNNIGCCLVNKNTTCQCNSECQTKRCPCLKTGMACVSECKCKNCKNPFNERDPEERLSDCARHHIKRVNSLSSMSLNKKYELPCGCGNASLKNLLEDYICQDCDELHFYSFCMGSVVDTNSMWHCCACGTCREDGERHCENCNSCTYGVSLSCANCGKKSPYAPRG